MSFQASFDGRTVLITGASRGLGAHFSETPRSAGEIVAYSDAMADMFCAYLTSLKRV